MKKSGIFTFVAILGTLVLASCNKDFTCTCTTTDSSGSVQPTTEQFPITNASNEDATAACNNNEWTDGPLTTNCELN